MHFLQDELDEEREAQQALDDMAESCEATPSPEWGKKVEEYESLGLGLVRAIIRSEIAKELKVVNENTKKYGFTPREHDRITTLAQALEILDILE